MDPVLIETAEGVATLTLNRPDQANSLDMALARRLRDLSGEVAADPKVRCVVLTGAGRMFCGGGDVGSFAAAEEPGAFVTELASTLHESTRTFAQMRKPLLVLVNGAAAGAGLGLAAVGDVVLAARSAHFSAAYSRIGMTPDGGLTWLLPRLVGMRLAQEMILANRRLSADDAERFGLITRAVDDGELPAEGRAMARRLAEGSPSALGTSKALLFAGATESLATQLAAEAKLIGLSAETPDGREGVAAFLARRAPRFSGETA